MTPTSILRIGNEFYLKPNELGVRVRETFMCAKFTIVHFTSIKVGMTLVSKQNKILLILTMAVGRSYI